MAMPRVQANACRQRDQLMTYQSTDPAQASIDVDIQVDFQLGDHDEAARLLTEAFAEVVEKISAAATGKEVDHGTDQ